MAEESTKKHHLFNHTRRTKADEYGATAEEEYLETTTVTEVVSTGEELYEREEKQHKRKEHLGEMGAVAAGAFALYEKHEAKKDPEHAHQYKVEEEVAAAAVGSGGFAFHEHHEKKEDRREAEEAAGSGEKKHHHLFGRD